MAIATVVPALDLSSSRALELCCQVVERIEIEDAVTRHRAARTPARIFRALMELEVARWCARAGPDRLDVVNAAFWQMCPPETR